MLKVAICDDEQKDIDIAEKCILEYSFKHNLDIECTDYRTGQELLSKLESGEHYDVFIFDVEMEKQPDRYFKDRCVLYVMKLGDKALDKGEKYDKIRKTDSMTKKEFSYEHKPADLFHCCG